MFERFSNKFPTPVVYFKKCSTIIFKSSGRANSLSGKSNKYLDANLEHLKFYMPQSCTTKFWSLLYFIIKKLSWKFQMNLSRIDWRKLKKSLKKSSIFGIFLSLKKPNSIKRNKICWLVLIDTNLDTIFRQSFHKKKLDFSCTIPTLLVICT
jgi:hypothetical protein